MDGPPPAKNNSSDPAGASRGGPVADPRPTVPDRSGTTLNRLDPRHPQQILSRGLSDDKATGTRSATWGDRARCGLGPGCLLAPAAVSSAALLSNPGDACAEDLQLDPLYACWLLLLLLSGPGTPTRSTDCTCAVADEGCVLPGHFVLVISRPGDVEHAELHPLKHQEEES